jgi:hypothetical protein
MLFQQRSCQTLPKLTLLLLGLQLQPINSIAQPLLLLLRLAHADRRDGGTASCWAGLADLFGFTRRGCSGQSPFLEIALGHERLLSSLHFVEIRLDSGKQRVDFRLYL